MIRITRTGWLFSGMCLLLYVAAVTSQSGFLLLLIGVFGGCLGFNGYLARQSVLHVTVDCPPNLQVEVETTVAQPWKLTNESHRAVGMVRIECDGRTLLSLRELAPRQSLNLAPNMQFSKRGVYPYQRMRLLSRFPFGLIEYHKPLELKGEIVVYPKLFLTASPQAHGFDAMVGGKYRGNRKSSSGSNFSGIRPFQHGDAFKQIHWKSSSKGHGLMVKVFDEELSGRVGFLVDSGNSGNPNTLDAMAAAVGSLVFAAQDAGHHVEWFDCFLNDYRLVPPFADGGDILDSLARMQCHPEGPIAESMERGVDRISRKAALCLMLTQWTPAMESFTNTLCAGHRKVAVYLPESDPTGINADGFRVYRYTETTIRRMA